MKRKVAENIIGSLLLVLAAGCSGADMAAEPPAPLPLSPTATEITFDPSPTNTSIKETAIPTKGGISEDVEKIFEPDMVLIPAGEFVMGADPQIGYEICLVSREGCTLADFSDESPPHAVYLDTFQIFVYEVTNAQYRLCVEVGGCGEPVFTDFYHDENYAEHPVVYVDWFSAANFCQWAGGRLPTEAEWEKAARGDNGWIFPWGDEPACEKANFAGCNFGEVTMPVGSYPAGASMFGVMDMAGNAAEWTADWYAPEYYAVSPAENPSGPLEGEMRTARGGSWKNPAVGVRSSNRGGNYPEVFSSGVGFRCVVDVE